MIECLSFTRHAQKRMAQRNVSESDISFILQHSHETHCAGVLLITCRYKDIPKSHLDMDRFRKLDGVTVVMSHSEPTILTVWRNRQHGQRHIRRKPRHGF